MVENVVRLSAMWRLLNVKTLYYRDGSQNGIMPVPETNLFFLQRLAQQIMSSAERDILEEIDHLTPYTVHNLRNAPAVWAILWAMILLYRESLEECFRHGPTGGSVTDRM